MLYLRMYAQTKHRILTKTDLMIYPLQLPFSLIIVAPTKVPNTTLTNVQLSEDMNKRRMFVAFC